MNPNPNALSHENPAVRKRRLETVQVPLDRDLFMRTLIRHLAGTLEEVVGLDEATGFISVVGQQMGEDIGKQYREALGKTHLTQSEVAEVLVDLKQRIQGDFRVIQETSDMLLLRSRSCPFGDKVIGRSSMCMMTSNVFGAIASQSLGYAKVELRETIALGHEGCLIAVYLNPEAGEAAEGREYYAD